MAFGCDDAVLRGAPAPGEQAEGDDAGAGSDCGDEGSVEARLDAKTPVQESVPARRGPAGEGGEGSDPAGRRRGRRGERLVSPRARDGGHRHAPGDARAGDHDVGARSRSLAGDRTEGLQRGPGRRGELVVGGGHHARGDRLLHGMTGQQAAGERPGDRPGRARDAGLHRRVRGPAGDPPGAGREAGHGQTLASHPPQRPRRRPTIGLAIVVRREAIMVVHVRQIR